MALLGKILISTNDTNFGKEVQKKITLCKDPEVILKVALSFPKIEISRFYSGFFASIPSFFPSLSLYLYQSLSKNFVL